MSTHEIVHGDGESRHPARFNAFSAPNDTSLCEFACIRLAEQVSRFAGEVQHLILRNARFGIGAGLSPRVEIKARVRHFHEQENVFRLGMSVSIIIISITEDGKVWNRFRNPGQSDRSLTADHKSLAMALRENRIQPRY